MAILPPPRRILVCGGRDYDNRERVYAVLDRLHASRLGSVGVIITGRASGADTLAWEWAWDRKVNRDSYWADWDAMWLAPDKKKTGRGGRLYWPAAGLVRNQLMLKLGKPALCVSFPGGSGTRNMMDLARGGGVRVMEV